MRCARFCSQQAKTRQQLSREQGFILLLVLWFLLLAGVVGTAIMLSGLQSARHANAEEQLLRVDLALEAARDEILYDLLVHGPRSQWASHGATGTSRADGISISAKVTNEAGRLDLNSAPYESIEPVLEAAGLEDRDRIAVIAAIDDKRSDSSPSGARYGSFAELRAIPGITQDVIKCLLPNITLYTGRTEPAAQWAPSALLDALKLEPVDTAQPEHQRYVLAGSVYRLQLVARLDGPSREAMTVARFTGKPHAPVWLYPKLPVISSDRCP